MCPYCASRARVLLGTLGYLRWFRCQDCGGQFSKTIRRPHNA